MQYLQGLNEFDMLGDKMLYSETLVRGLQSKLCNRLQNFELVTLHL